MHDSLVPFAYMLAVGFVLAAIIGDQIATHVRALPF